MKLTCTKEIQSSVELALKQPTFSIVYKEEAEKIIDQDVNNNNNNNNIPVTVELLHHVSTCLGKRVKT
jgi:hypothetical protein